MSRFSLFLFCLCLTPAFALLTPEPHRSLIDSGIRLTLNQQYDSAFYLLKQASLKNPSEPLFDYYLMLAYEGMMIDYETTTWEKSFDSLYYRLEERFKLVRKQEPKNPWALYFLGTLYVTRGAHELRFSHYLNFTKSILNGIKLLKSAAALDSTLYDAYLYIGLFQFARSKLVGWIPLFDDERETAIAMMEKAADSSRFSREFALQVLAGLYGQTGELEKAEKVASRFREKYPDNRAIHWILGNAYLAQKRYTDAEREFQILKPLIETGIPKKYQYNYVTIDLLLAEIASKTGRCNEAIAYCEHILQAVSSDKRIDEVKAMAIKLSGQCGKNLKTGKRR